MRTILLMLIFMYFVSCGHSPHDAKSHSVVHSVDSFLVLSADSAQVFLKDLNEKDYNLLYLEILEKLQYSVAKIDTLAVHEYNHNEYITDLRAYFSTYSDEMKDKITVWRKNTPVPDSVYKPDFDSNYLFISYIMYTRFPEKFDSLVNQHRHYVDSLPSLKKDLLESF